MSPALARLLALLPAAFPAAGAEPFLALAAGDWRGGGYARSDDGRFSHCSAERDGRLTLSIDAGYELVVSLAAPGTGDPGPLPQDVLLDGALLGRFPVARSDGLLHARLGRRPDLYTRLRSGAVLELRGAERRVRTPLSGAGAALERVRECVELARSFSSGPDNPYLPGNDPVYPPPAGVSFDTRARVRALLRAAGLSRAAFGSADRLGAAGAPLAWSQGELLGFALLEARNERSIGELERHHLSVLAAGCTGRPELEALPPGRLAGYTLHQATVTCPVARGVRIAVTTSVLDSADVVSFVHMGLQSQRRRLEQLNRSLRGVLDVLLRR